MSTTCPTGFEKFIHIRTIDECMHAGQGQHTHTHTQIDGEYNSTAQGRLAYIYTNGIVKTHRLPNERTKKKQKKRQI
jgi:hypothetical protein